MTDLLIFDRVRRTVLAAMHDMGPAGCRPLAAFAVSDPLRCVTRTPPPPGETSGCDHHLYSRLHGPAIRISPAMMSPDGDIILFRQSLNCFVLH